jgi:7-carboxy-7-deazaguanine synthase
VGDGLTISEVFGPTVQGEGPSAGRRCGFLRLALCNLDCAWCDTPYTWDWSGKNGTAYDRKVETRREALSDVAAALVAMPIDMLVVSGGEPLVQTFALARLLALLPPEWWVEIETNGTKIPSDGLAAYVDQWNVSPKLAHSGVARERAWVPDALDWFVNRAPSRVAFKFVCQTKADLDEVALLVEASGMDARTVWIMPEGRDHDTLRRHGEDIADEAIRRGWNLTGRMHVELWGDTRGR